MHLSEQVRLKINASKLLTMCFTNNENDIYDVISIRVCTTYQYINYRHKRDINKLNGGGSNYKSWNSPERGWASKRKIIN